MEELISIDDLCTWKPARHTDIETGENTKEFEMCATCTGYEAHKDCYWPHRAMDEYLIKNAEEE